MSSTKISVSISEPTADFVERYRKKRGLNRSQVFEVALRLLRSRELEDAYRAANAETSAEWDITASDGLSDETW